MSRSISLWLDSYDDIFSDFDPRHYQERTLSDDFITAIKKVYHESEMPVLKIQLFIPQQLRDAGTEKIIVQRLHEYFSMGYYNLKKRSNRKRAIGTILSIIGMTMMFIAGFISKSQSTHVLASIIFVIAEPAGWFMVWAGMENIYNSTRIKQPELVFFKHLSAGKPIFISLKNDEKKQS